MVERQSSERETARIAEGNARVLGETTLKEIGVESPNDNLNLASDRVILAVVGDTKLAFVHHPFSGEHFAQLLGNIAPFGSGSKSGILADFQMPIDARKSGEPKSLRETADRPIAVRLHKRHLGDPRVAPLYQMFIHEHLNSWRRSLRNDSSSEVFDRLQRVRFITNIQDYVGQLFAEWNERLSNGEETETILSELTRTAFHYYQRENGFRAFLKSNIGLQKGENLLTRFADAPLVKKRELFYAFLKQLTEEEKEEFVITKDVDMERRVLADVNSRKVWQGNYYSTKFEFVDKTCVEIKDDEGTVVRVTPNRNTGSGTFDWKVADYKFSPDYLKTSRYPVVAWEKDKDGQRRFLSQSEAKQYLARLGFKKARRGDVKIGEIVAALFSPNITSTWEKKMPLYPLDEDEEDGQRMMGAQMPIWVSMLHHEKQLLSDDNPFFSILEERMASLAQSSP